MSHWKHLKCQNNYSSCQSFIQSSVLPDDFSKGSVLTHLGILKTSKLQFACKPTTFLLDHQLATLFKDLWPSVDLQC